MLNDGASLNIATSNDVDRKGIVYGGEIAPDYLVKPGGNGRDLVLEAASGWLLAQPACTISQ
jgi:hypothetical protein